MNSLSLICKIQSLTNHSNIVESLYISFCVLMKVESFITNKREWEDDKNNKERIEREIGTLILQ